MASEQDCVSALGMVTALLPAVADQLRNSKGYAFQAYVFAMGGRRLAEDRRWEWISPHGHATFARSAGGTLQQATSQLTYLQRNDDHRIFCQELTVQGRSGALHQLDACLVRPLPANWLGGHVPYSIVGAVIECKNQTKSFGIGDARECLGLVADFQRTWSAFPRIAVVTAQAGSNGAMRFLGTHGQALLPLVDPNGAEAWAAELGAMVRFPPGAVAAGLT